MSDGQPSKSGHLIRLKLGFMFSRIDSEGA